MKTDIDLKNIWFKQETETPKVEDLYAKANKLKRTNLIKLIVVNVLLLSTILFVGFIWYYYQPELITTKIGITLTILSMVIFLVPLNRQFTLLSTNKSEPSSKDFLRQLIKLKKQQSFIQTRMLSIYFILLSLGIGLYFIEYVLMMSTTWGVITYSVTAIWITINWVYLRPLIIKKQSNKIDGLIDGFQEIENQLIE